MTLMKPTGQRFPVESAAIPAERFRCRASAATRLARVAGPLLLVAGCDGRQSVLAPAGEDAAAVYTLFIVLLAGASVVWLVMNGMFYWFSRRRPAVFPERNARLLIVIGGVVTPAVVVGGVLVWGLSLLPDQRMPGDGLRIAVTGEQWWWRVEYWPEGATEPIISANEIRLPTGERTEFLLTSDRVIHSFWIPALGGKMDMLPGRETRMSLLAQEPGVYRGQCAEFCGASHAWMAFALVAMPPRDFDAWLASEAGDAATPTSDAALRGRALFRREGCGACHSVRGTEAIGTVGPDLTHVGSRRSIGAGRLDASLEDFALWVAHADELKPEVRMPAFSHLDPGERRDLARYLKELE